MHPPTNSKPAEIMFSPENITALEQRAVDLRRSGKLEITLTPEEVPVFRWMATQHCLERPEIPWLQTALMTGDFSKMTLCGVRVKEPS